MFKVEFADGVATEWRRDGDGATPRRNPAYHPTLYVRAGADRLARLADALADDPKVHAVGYEERYPSLQARRDGERERVLAVSLDRTGEVRTLAREVTTHYAGDAAPGAVRLYDVDLDPQFRYALDTRDPGDGPPLPEGLSTATLAVPERSLARECLEGLTVDGQPVAGSRAGRLRAVAGYLERHDPDVLVCSHADLVSLLCDLADEAGMADFALGRRPGYRTLAGENTVESYGQVLHSPARYDVPGRVLVDQSGSFLLGRGGLAGLRYLVGATRMPLQETARASIGGVLTALQIRAARERDVLVPLQKWRPESFKSVDVLHAADRGGHTFDPAVGYHEDVHELDFASLYPNVIREYGVSPEAVGCPCHPDRRDVPGLDYAVCPDAEGFLGSGLAPLLEDRAAFKEIARGDGPGADRAAAKAEAIKWVLVSCFGYQGYRNAKFGRIECHEAINAVAREILLDARRVLEAGGWRVVHGIVDSVWVTPADPDPDPLADLATVVTRDAGIRFEHEADYAWCCFVPRREGASGALTRYFGKRADGTCKLRGIEARQRSTPAFVADAQRDLLEVIDADPDPAAVVDAVAPHRRRLREGAVPAEDLVVRQRVTRRAGEYEQRTLAAAALARSARLGVERHPGQDVRYVVVDADPDASQRVRLHFEDGAGYDPAHYDDLLVRATESVVSPFGWDRDDVRRHLRDDRVTTLSSFG